MQHLFCIHRCTPCQRSITLIFGILFLIMFNGCGKRTSARRKAYNLLQQAEFAMTQGAYPKALAFVEESLQEYKLLPAQLLQANLYYMVGHWALSSRLYQKLLLNKKLKAATRADCMNNMALSLYNIGNWQQARIIWQQLTTDAHYVSKEVAWYNLGLLYLYKAAEQNNPATFYDLALRSFEQAVTIAPTYIDALYYAAVTKIEQNDVIGARQYLNALLKRAPNHQRGQQLSQKIGLQ